MDIITAPMRAKSFATLGERRKWVAALPDGRTRITTTPTEKRLRAANDNRRAAALDAIDALLAPHVPDCIADPAEKMDKAAVGKGWRMRPDLGEIERAMIGRVAVRSAAGRTHAARAGGTVHIGPLVFTRTRRSERGPVMKLGEIVNGDIRITAGTMIERGRTALGEIMRPCEYRTFERADEATQADMEADKRRAIRSYIALRGDWGNHESWADRIGGFGRPVQRPTAATTLAEAIANTPVMPPVTRLPDAILFEGHWIGGVCKVSGNSSGHDNAASRAFDEMMRTIAQRRVAAGLTLGEARVLALATSSATAAEAGADLGMTRQRFAASADAALDKVSELLAA